jgi:hypothetical protein
VAWSLHHAVERHPIHHLQNAVNAKFGESS